MKINYIFSKDPKNSTLFDILRTKYSSDEYRTLILKLSENSPSEKFKDLQKDDLLMPFNDTLTRTRDNIMIVTSVNYLDGLYEVTFVGLDKSIYDMDEFDDDDKLVVLARVER